MKAAPLALLLALSSADALRVTSGSPVALPELQRLRGGALKTPGEAYQAMVEKGTANANAPLAKGLHQAFMGGMYVAIGGVFALVVAGAAKSLGAEAQRFIIGAIFPVGLVFILTAAGQLMTGNFALCTAAWYEGRISTSQLLRSYLVAGVGNTIGCSTMSILIKEAGLLKGGMAELIAGTAVKKCGAPLVQTFIKAILCNWLVSLAIFLATCSADMPGKVLGVWSCIPMFVSIGLEHSVANIFFLPLGKLAGADISYAQILMRNVLIVTLGNLLGGAGILAGGMSFQFGALGK